MSSTNNKLVRDLDNIPFDKNKVTLVSGYFDLLHPGHVSFLKECKNIGYPLLVIVYSDKICFSKRPGRPILDENDRAFMLSELSLVDWVYISNAYPIEDSGEVYKVFRPRIVVFSKGEENINIKNDEIDLIKFNFPEIKIEYIQRQRQDISTTQIIEKAVNSQKSIISTNDFLHTEKEIKNKLQEISKNSNASKKQATILVNSKAGTLLSYGYNYHPKFLGEVVHKNKNTHEFKDGLPRPMHSEVVAIVEFIKKYRQLPDKDIFLYTTALPCAGCAEIINLVSIKNVRYINDFDNNYGELILLSKKVDLKKF